MQDGQGNKIVYTSPSGQSVYETPQGARFILVGAAGKERYVFSNVYKDLATGELIWFEKLDKRSPKPSPDKYEAVTMVAGKRRTKKRSLLKLRKVGQKRLRRTVGRKRLL